MSATNAQFYVGIGAQKAGTTWLHDYLARHPQVAVAPEKELHYFDAKYRPGLCGIWNKRWQETHVELLEQYQRTPDEALQERIRCISARLEMVENPERYRDYFTSLVGEGILAYGEITPSYSLLPVAGYEEILHHFPQAKFVFIARDPVQRFLSQVRFTCKKRNIQPANDEEAGRLALSYIENPQFSLRGDYRRTLSALYSVVARERVHVAFYEHLFEQDTLEPELVSLCDFLGIEPVPADIGSRLNPTGAVNYAEEVIAQVRRAHAAVYDYMHATLGKRVPASWQYGSGD